MFLSAWKIDIFKLYTSVKTKFVNFCELQLPEIAGLFCCLTQELECSAATAFLTDLKTLKKLGSMELEVCIPKMNCTSQWDTINSGKALLNRCPCKTTRCTN